MIGVAFFIRRDFCEVQKNIIKIDTPELSITYVDETYKESFDSKLFREQNPDLYDNYVKMSPVKASLRLKVK